MKGERCQLAHCTRLTKTPWYTKLSRTEMGTQIPISPFEHRAPDACPATSLSPHSQLRHKLLKIAFAFKVMFLALCAFLATSKQRGLIRYEDFYDEDTNSESWESRSASAEEYLARLLQEESLPSDLAQNIRDWILRRDPDSSITSDFFIPDDGRVRRRRSRRRASHRK